MTHQVCSEIQEAYARSRASVLGTACQAEGKDFPHGMGAWGDRVGAACTTRGSVYDPLESCRGGTPGPFNGQCCAWGPGQQHSGTNDSPSPVYSPSVTSTPGCDISCSTYGHPASKEAYKEGSAPSCPLVSSSTYLSLSPHRIRCCLEIKSLY